MKKVPAKPRGRPPKPGGPTPRAEVQRAYRARLAAAGKVMRIVDANAVTVQSPIPDFDPARDGVFEREMIASMRDQLRNALSKVGFLEDEVARLRERDAEREREREQVERDLTNALKDKITLQDEVTRLRARRR